MKLLQRTEELAGIPGPLVLAIGVFDGLHLGHQSVIRTAQQTAKNCGGRAVILTFDPHPARILKPEAAPRMLTSTPHKVRLLREWALDHALILSFSHQTAQTLPDHFVRELAAHCRPLHAICVGESWSFGRERRGNLHLLSALGEELGFRAIGVPELLLDGAVVSSTRIRQAVSAGDLATASKLLGRPYAVAGTVVHGRQLGRSIGFPTANLPISHEQVPPHGVYAVLVSRPGTTALLPGVANVGLRPTVGESNPQITLEVHLFDRSGDFYGEFWEVRFVDFLRPEKRFPDVEALRHQIAQDAALARSHLGAIGEE
jgi:riboflavin kinase/FMN adenylyltransferase